MSEATVRQDVAEAVAKADPTSAKAVIVEEVLNVILPQILHSTNQEPWYQSRVTWGAIISIVAAIGAPLGLQLSGAMQGSLADLAVVALPVIIGAATTLWGRWAARKPIGS